VPVTARTLETYLKTNTLNYYFCQFFLFFQDWFDIQLAITSIGHAVLSSHRRTWFDHWGSFSCL